MMAVQLGGDARRLHHDPPARVVLQRVFVRRGQNPKVHQEVAFVKPDGGDPLASGDDLADIPDAPGRAEQHDELNAARADAVTLLQLGHDFVRFAHLLGALQVRDQESVETGPDRRLRVGVELGLVDRDERFGTASAQPAELFADARNRARHFCSAGSE